MAYDRYDREERSRWSEDRGDRGWRGDNRPHRAGGGGRDERGFWDRASDEVASWFGDDDAERRRHHDQRHDERMEAGGRAGGRSGRDFNYDRGVFSRGGSSERDYERGGPSESRGGRGAGGYRPVTGDYGRGSDHESDQFFAASGYGRGERAFGDYRRESDRSEGPWSGDEYRRTSFAGSQKSDRDFDPHYRNWRDRHLSDLDRDYDDFRQEHQSKFESDFSSWRERRQQKRGLLGQVREHMEVVGSDGEHVGTVDKTAGDRIILTKSDPESGGAHHSISCADVDKIEGDRVMLDCKADEARTRWRDESRSRALFERDDQGEMGPGVLDRSFSGTYR